MQESECFTTSQAAIPLIITLQLISPVDVVESKNEI